MSHSHSRVTFLLVVPLPSVLSPLPKPQVERFSPPEGRKQPAGRCFVWLFLSPRLAVVPLAGLSGSGHCPHTVQRALPGSRETLLLAPPLHSLLYLAAAMFALPSAAAAARVMSSATSQPSPNQKNKIPLMSSQKQQQQTLGFSPLPPPPAPAVNCQPMGSHRLSVSTSIKTGHFWDAGAGGAQHGAMPRDQHKRGPPSMFQGRTAAEGC